MLTTAQREQFRKYRYANRSIFSDRVVHEFFQRDHHIELLLRAHEGEDECRRDLEDRFRKHFFRMRFVKFLSSTIKYYTLDELRIHRKRDTRIQLILDRPSSEEGDGTTLGELLGTASPQRSEPVTPAQFQASFTNEQLATAFAALSPKQKNIATLFYALCYHDNEIARMLGVTPQAVCKTRHLALQKLRQRMSERR